MRKCSIIFISVIAVAVIAASAVITRADQPQSFLSPDNILKGTTPTITMPLVLHVSLK